MKISKLFHWLYAFLMFLPIIFVLPTLLYYGINKNAVIEEKVETTIHYYESNAVNNQSDLIVGNVYTFNNHSNFDGSYYSSYKYEISKYILVSGTPNQTTTNYGPFYNSFEFDTRGSLIIYTATQKLTIAPNRDFVFDFLYEGTPPTSEVSWPIEFISECTRDIPNGQTEFFVYPGIVGDVEHEFNKVFEMPLFSWASDNFISVPFTYLTSLFGIATSSVINKYLCYWLSISVIWLCFDVIMYVPLLCHRWIDKARIE